MFKVSTFFPDLILIEVYRFVINTVTKYVSCNTVYSSPVESGKKEELFEETNKKA